MLWKPKHGREHWWPRRRRPPSLYRGWRWMGGTRAKTRRRKNSKRLHSDGSRSSMLALLMMLYKASATKPEEGRSSDHPDDCLRLVGHAEHHPSKCAHHVSLYCCIRHSCAGWTGAGDPPVFFGMTGTGARCGWSSCLCAAACSPSWR